MGFELDNEKKKKKNVEDLYLEYLSIGLTLFNNVPFLIRQRYPDTKVSNKSTFIEFR